MIIERNKIVNESNCKLEEVQFTIDTSTDKMFHLLSNLYTNPLGAVIREISTNCLDAHRLSDNIDKPFQINISGEMEDNKYIEFRDYGPGMSEDQVKNIFTVMGKSTKENTNDQTGCLGLGSKSPHAISETYSVISINNNIKTIYNISKNEIGIPKLVIFASIETHEENGLIVRVPLKKEFYNKYKLNKIIEEQLHFFKNKPIVKFGEEVQKLNYFNPENYNKLNNHYIRKENFTSLNNLKVVQGEVSYEIDYYDLTREIITYDDKRISSQKLTISDKLEMDRDKLEQLKELCRNFQIILVANMGKVTFAMNREKLIYDKKTVLNIINYLNDILIAYQKKLNDIVEKYPLKWDKYMILNKFYHLNNEIITDELRNFNKIYVSELMPNNISIKTIYSKEACLLNITRMRSIDAYDILKIYIQRENYINCPKQELKNLSSEIIILFTNDKYCRKHSKEFLKHNDNISKIMLIVEGELTDNNKKKFLDNYGFDNSMIITIEEIKKFNEDNKEIIIKDKKAKSTKRYYNNNINKWRNGGNEFIQNGRISQIQGIKVLSIRGQYHIGDLSKCPKLNELYKNGINYSDIIDILNLSPNFKFDQPHHRIFHLNKADYNKAKNMISMEEFLENEINNIKNFKYMIFNEDYNLRNFNGFLEDYQTKINKDNIYKDFFEVFLDRRQVEVTRRIYKLSKRYKTHLYISEEYIDIINKILGTKIKYIQSTKIIDIFCSVNTKYYFENQVNNLNQQYIIDKYENIWKNQFQNSNYKREE